MQSLKFSTYGKPLFQCYWSQDHETQLFAYYHGIVLLYRGRFADYHEKGSEKFNELHQELATLYEETHDKSKYISGTFHNCKSCEQYVTDHPQKLVPVKSAGNLNMFTTLKREYIIMHSDKCNELRDVLLLWAGVDKHADR